MRKLSVLFILIAFTTPVFAGGTFVVTESQYIVISGNTPDTLGRTMIEPDSIRITVVDSAGIELHDAWYDSSDVQCMLNGDIITFFDQWEDINGSDSTGIFNIMVTIASDAQGDVDVFSNQNYVVICVDTAVNNAFAASGQALAEVVNIDAWNPITDNDSLIIDQSSRIPVGDTNQIDLSNYDETSPYDPATDSVNVDISNFNSATPDVNVASVDSNALEAVDFEDHFLKESKIDSGAITQNKVAISAFDSARFADNYWNAVSNSGGSASVPDSITARIDSILASLGFDASTSAHDKIDNLSLSGGGTEPETLIVMSLSDSTVIGGATVVVRTLDQTTVIVDGLLTNVNGRLLLELDADSFFMAATHNNYTQILDTVTVHSGGGTDTLWMAEFDPGQPSSPDLCRVYGWLYDISGGVVEQALVTAEIPADYHPVKYNSVIITPFRKIAESDSAGYWYIDLFPNQLLSKTDSKYLMTIEYPSGVIFKTETAVPDTSSWQLQ
jgi:hypothetical protein